MPAAPQELAPKILEIGSVPYLHEAFPRTTDFYSTWPEETMSDPAKGRHIVSLANLSELKQRLADPAYDLVVVQSGPFAPWSLRGLGRSLFRRSALRGSFPAVRALGTELLRGRVAAPI